MAKNILRVLALATVSLFVGAAAHAEITGTSASAKVQILGTTSPDVHASDAGATSANADLTQSGTGLNVHEDLSFNSLTSESAVFNFSVGMHANTSYLGTAYMGDEGSAFFDNRGTIDYHAVTDLTATVTYDFNVTGSNIIGMGPIYFYNPVTVDQFQAGSGVHSPTTGHFSGSFSFDMLAGTNYFFRIAFEPNVFGTVSDAGLAGPIDGEYNGQFAFSFGASAAAVPEPETYAMLLAGLGLLGFAARRGNLKAA